MSNSAIPRIVARQAPLSRGFSRQEYWSRLPFPSPEDLLDPGIESGSPALQADSLPFELQGRHIAAVFPVVMYISESWTIKKVEHRRIDAFELWCWLRLLRVQWTTRRSIQSVLKEINPEYSLEGLNLKLRLQ